MKLNPTLLIPALAVAFAASALAQTASQPAKPAPKAPAAAAPGPPARVVMDTSMGRITCQFFPKSAPQAVANFAGLATGTKAFVDPVTGMRQPGRRYYDGTIFHRVIPGFMIQGGDPTGTGSGNPGYMFVDEFDPSLNFDVPGRLAMANSGPNTNGSQFFVTEQPYPSLSQHYTIFGQCDDASVQVVKAIGAVPRDSHDRPLTPVVLKKVIILREGQPLPPVPGQPQAQDSIHKVKFIKVSDNAENLDVVAHPKFINISAGAAERLLESHPEPVYPPIAKAARLSGIVVLSAVIGTDGLVKDLQVVNGPNLLQQAALDAAKQWRYRPYLLDGQPVEVHTRINIAFTLR